jgi:hypothetical protein
VEPEQRACHIAYMQQNTDGRVVRFLTRRHAAEGPGLEQWFLVAIGDDEKAKDEFPRQLRRRTKLLRSSAISLPAASPVGV